MIATYSDASNSGWGGVFPDKSGNSMEVRDFWSSSESTQPIIIREALALKIPSLLVLSRFRLPE